MQRDRVPLCETYRGRWREILETLGVPAKALVNRHGPCPVCGGTDRFRFDDRDHKGTFFCSHCGAGDGPKLAMLFLACDFTMAADKIRAAAGGARVAQSATPQLDASQREETPATKRARMNWLWGKALPVRESNLGGTYLAGRLGRFPTGTGLRLHQACPYPKGEDRPAMLAVFVGADGIPSGLHRTYLGVNGDKAPVISPKLSLGPLVDGGAVRLAPPASRMGIAEGIETALAASILFNMPVWAAINANRLATWEPPADAREVVIFADNDENFIGQLAAFDLDARLTPRMRCTIETPLEVGSDWNDVLRGRRAAAR